MPLPPLIWRNSKNGGPTDCYTQQFSRRFWTFYRSKYAFAKVITNVTVDYTYTCEFIICYDRVIETSLTVLAQIIRIHAFEI